MEFVASFLGIIERLIFCINVVLRPLLRKKRKKWMVKKAKYIWRSIPVWRQRLREEYYHHFRLMNENNPPNQCIEKIQRFFALVLFAIVAANMYFTSATFAIIAFCILYLNASLFTFLAGGVLAVLFWKVARFYRADAYNVADRLGINIVPWKQE